MQIAATPVSGGHGSSGEETAGAGEGAEEDRLARAGTAVVTPGGTGASGEPRPSQGLRVYAADSADGSEASGELAPVSPATVLVTSGKRIVHAEDGVHDVVIVQSSFGGGNPGKLGCV